MRHRFLVLILTTCLTTFNALPAAAWFFGDDTLVSIDNRAYSMEDFKTWWGFWNDDGSPVPQTPQPYVDWLLLGLEGERMGLAETPEFKRRTQVFIQSRGLLKLKYDEVDSQVNITDADIKMKYNEEYLPRWQVQRLMFNDEQTADSARQKLLDNAMTIDELLVMDPEQGGPVAAKEDWLRPIRVNTEWAEIFRDLPVGGIVDPSEYGGGPVLYMLKQQEGATDADLAVCVNAIKSDLEKERKRALTQNLVNNLRKKYQVQIDEERLTAIDINAPDDTYTDDVIVTTSQRDITERDFMAVIRRLMTTRKEAGHAGGDEDLAHQLKASTINNILAQSVLDWEVLNRHYETEPPFKSEYEFNYRHRLGVAVQDRLVGTEIVISEEQVRQHYEQHPERYTRPASIKFTVVNQNQGPIDQLWAAVSTGEDFYRSYEQLFGHAPVVKQAQLKDVDPLVRAELDKLNPGEMSRVFELQGAKTLIRVVDRSKEEVLPFQSVKETIQTTLLNETKNRLRNDYLESLRAQVEIEVSNKNWATIKKKLERDE